MTKKTEFNKVAIIGIGLIGSSLARALKASKRVKKIFGVDTDEDTIEYALKNKIIDEGSREIAAGASGAEIIVIATHVGAIVETARAVIPLAAKGTVITDVGSVKGKIVRGVEKAIPSHIHFVGGHPIAGTENSGVRVGDARLFLGKRFILTPTQKSDPKAKKKVTALWKAAGSDVYEMDVDTHDRVFGFVSHLPHLVAYSLIDAVLSGGDSDTLFEYAGGGLRDFTRIAASSPTLWTDIFKSNKRHLLTALRKFKKSLERLEAAIESDDPESLRKNLSRIVDIKRKGVK
jgi:prephenate dehydrogenase